MGQLSRYKISGNRLSRTKKRHIDRRNMRQLSRCNKDFNLLGQGKEENKMQAKLSFAPLAIKHKHKNRNRKNEKR